MTATDDLRAGCRGPVVMPSDPGYDNARRMWNAAVDHRPAAIVRCADAADITAAVLIARQHRLAVAIRGGGHGIAAHAAVDGSVLLDLSVLDEVVVDPSTRRATVGPGVTWADLDRATQQQGLAVTGADVSTVGVIGSALAGGSGWLQRMYGLTCDNIQSARIVLADGTHIATDPHNHPDLFWALCGGGANFGVVTALELALHPVTDVYAGTLVYSYDRARTVLDGYQRLSAMLPDTASLQAALLHWPPGAATGPPVAALSATCFGPPERAAEILRPVREVAEPDLDLLRPQTYLGLQGQSEHAFLDGHAMTTGTEWLATLDEATIDGLVAAGLRMPTPYSMVSLHQLGGAMSRIPAPATAFGFRTASQHLVLFAGAPAHDDLGPAQAWVRETLATAHDCSAGGPYIALLDNDGSPDRARSAYTADTYRLLTRLKARYDPNNLFRGNHNIAPTPDDTRARSLDAHR